MRQPARLVILAAIAASLTACATTPEATTSSSPVVTENPSPVTTTADTGNPSPVTAIAEADIKSLGVEDANAIKWEALVPGTPSPNGYFDAVNAISALEHSLPKTGTVQLGGWAVIDSKKAPADKVIITQGDQDAVVAIVPVEADRPDLLNVSPNYKNAGWNATIDVTKLPGDSVVLKAWAYDASQKMAFQLNNEHTLNFTSAEAPAQSPEATPTP